MPESAGPWLAILASGLYHGLNPGMGWPLAVAAGLMGGGRRDLAAALGPLAIGHFAAIGAMLLPFAVMAALITWAREVRLAAALLLVGWGLWLLLGRHPRALGRIPARRLALWSFAVALGHGAALMLVPAYLGLCGVGGSEAGVGPTVAGNAMLAAAVAAVHSATMIAAGGACALAVHAWLGLGVLNRLWVNLDAVWAASLIAVGMAALVLDA
jgi:hypothetical protein